MRVALAHKLYKVTGGAEVFFRETARVLRDNGHETLMIATGDPADIEHGDNVLLLDAPAYDSDSKVEQLAALPSVIFDRRKERAIKEALIAFKPDILHVFAMNVHLSPAVIFAAEKIGVPIVGTFNDYKHICPNYKLFHHGAICMDCKSGDFINAVKNKCCKSSVSLSVASMIEAYAHKWMNVYDKFDHFTFSSDFLADITAEFWSGKSISWSKLLNPFDSGRHIPSDRYDNYGLFFGRIIEEKGVDVLIRESLAIGANRIKIVGNGPALSEMRALVEQLEIKNIDFLGPVWGEELDAIIRDARFTVVPSIWHENFPYVINQSFALARPVIGANRGGIPELISHGERGLVFDPKESGALSRAMTSLFNDEREARRLGRNAKIWSDMNFNDSTAINSLMEAYGEAKNENNRNRR